MRDTDELIRQKTPVWSRFISQSMVQGRLQYDAHNIPVVIGVMVIHNGDVVVEDGDGSVTRISVGQEPYQVEVDFLPGFPNLLGLPRGCSASGRWSIRIAGAPITGGSYHVSREGDRVAAFTWMTWGMPNIYWQSADGTSPMERLTTSSLYQALGSCSPDGTTLAFEEHSPPSNADILLLDANPPCAPLPEFPLWGV